MAYTLSIGNPRSNQAPTVQKSAKPLKLNKVLRFDQHSRETSNSLEIWHRGPINGPKSPRF
jgi:hypothetical protein